MISINDQFTTAPAADFAYAISQSGFTLAEVYNATYGAIDITCHSYDWAGAWILGSVPLCDTQSEELIFEIDVQLISDPAGRKNLGVLLVDSDLNGYSLAHIDTTWFVSKWMQWNPGAGLEMTGTLSSNPSFNAGQRHVLRARKIGDILELAVDGTVIFVGADKSIKSLRPALFFYGCTVRAHGVAVSSSTLGIALSTVSSSISWANKETREQAWPGEIAARPTPKQVPALLWRATEPVLPVDAKLTLGFIRGTITSRSEAVAGRRVICFGPSLDPVAETVSAADGSYRFDLLWLGREYLIMAMDNPAYQYNPAAADRRKPEAY